MSIGQVGRIPLFASILKHGTSLTPSKTARAIFNEIKSYKLHRLHVRRLTVPTSITTTEFPEFDSAYLGVQNHDELYQYSLQNPDAFWGTLAKSRLRWFKEFHQISDCDFRSGKIKWFLGGKLNASYNCVDRHYKKNPNKVALIWEKDEPGTQEFITYRELYQLVNRISNLLLSTGVKAGDRVALYLPVSPVAVASMLACSRIGAIHSVVFAGFSAVSLAGRINDAQAETVITADQAVRGGRIIELKKVVDDAIKSCPSVRQVFVSQRTGADVPMHAIDVPLDTALKDHPTECEPASLDSEDYIFILYTSGSTGKPKGLAHSIGGYLTYASTTFKHVFDYKDNEKFACVADIGWITGHSYVVYGPLLNGATTVLFESIPLYPNPGRYWEMTERLKLDHIYLSPTALRLLLKAGDSWVTQYDRSSLRKLGCVGEPLNHEAWHWYHHTVGEGRCDVIDTWWQTETGGICISPRPSSPGAPIKAGMPMNPFFGIDPVLLNDKGKEVTDNDATGSLCIRRPWPGLTRTVWGDHDRYIQTYFAQFPGYYVSGDGAYRDADGHYQITGRVDDVINVSGHRLGTAEIEDALCYHTSVAEAAVVGFPDEIKGEDVYAYVVLRDNIACSDEDMLRVDLNNLVKEKIAKYAVPRVIQFSPGLPRTRSGKIMRRILRNVAAGRSDELGDISTLADPSVVDVIVKQSVHVKATSQKA